MQAAATSIDNVTGNVVAIVGSRSQASISGYTLNRAYQSARQPGSAIKPLMVYMPYLQMGNNPDSIVTDESIEGGPVNADGVYAGDITLREAVRTSKNTVAWNILQRISPRSGVSFLTNMDFKNVWMDKDHIATALGGFTYGVTTEEMAGAYAAIANEGIYRKATCVIKIVDSSNKTIVDNSTRGSKIYDSNSCRMMTDMLKTVVTSGTGVSAGTDNAIIAGKTGTTNSTKDAWFCGYSRYYTTAVWMGYDYPKQIDSPAANEIFRSYMQKIHEGLSIVDFTPYTAAKGQQGTIASQTQTTQPETGTVSETQSSTEQTTTPAVNSTQTDNLATTKGQIQSNAGTQKGNNNTQSSKKTQPATTQAVTKATKSQLDVDATTKDDMDAIIKGGDW